ncbi:branched-chain amino acid transporter [bacterium]|jgi:branched-chain amino acid:cation transporter, LIVCS family|nr:branched-chain amino acid transporter [bacterium]
MKQNVGSYLIPTGLAIFSMLFGAGNLMFPINVGRIAGSSYPIATFGFLVTAAILPLIGLIPIILCRGDYVEFFGKIGKIPGTIAIFVCLTFIGPVYVMPRIVGVSHALLDPFIPGMSLVIFTILFLALTFLITYKESNIIDILGKVMSPLLLISLFIIIIKGYFTAGSTEVSSISSGTLFWKNFIYGYNTLDLFGAIFFSSIVISLLKKSLHVKSQADIKKLAIMGFKAGALGTFLLSLVYIGLSYIGAFHGQSLSAINEAEVFSSISIKILGNSGSIIVSIAVLMACLSTVVALATVFAEYLQSLTKNKLSYTTALVSTLIATGFSSNFGLTWLLAFYEPFIIIAHPALILLTFLVILNKLFGFKYIKVPVLATFALSFVLHYWNI